MVWASLAPAAAKEGVTVTCCPPLRAWLQAHLEELSTIVKGHAGDLTDPGLIPAPGGLAMGTWKGTMTL